MGYQKEFADILSRKKLNYDHVKPLMNWVLVKKDDSVRKTKSGIHMVVDLTANDFMQKGTVLRIGEGVNIKLGERPAMNINIGDRVMWSIKSGFTLDDKKLAEGDAGCMLIQCGDIYCILEAGSEPTEEVNEEVKA